MPESSFRARICRGQFLAGPEFPSALDGWRRLIIGELHLSVHPGGEVTKHRTAEVEVAVVGLIVDPRQPGASASAIAGRLVDVCSSFDAVERELDWLAGRFAMFVRIGSMLRVYPDATGSRSIVYLSADGTGQPWIASQPELIAEVRDLQRDDWFARYIPFGRPSPHTCPGDTTPYPEIHKLLPNWYLDLCTGRPHRFWPRRGERIGVAEPAAVIEAAAPLLQGIMRGLAHRRACALLLSSDCDSRVMFATARSIAGDFGHYTLVRAGERTEYDWEVPQRLLAGFGLPLRVVERVRPDAEFCEVFDRTVGGMVRGTAPIDTYTYLAELPADLLFVTAQGGEVARCRFHPAPVDPDPAACEDVIQAGLGCFDPRAERAIERWFKTVPRDTDAHPLDLYDWECRVGTWRAMEYTGADLAIDLVPLFNCRRLLATLLRAESRQRRPPYPLFRQLCATLCPEALRLPFDPES